MSEDNNILITENNFKFKTEDIQFRSVNRETQKKHLRVLYSLYFILIFVIVQTIPLDTFIDWMPLLFLVLYLITFAENYMDPLYKNFVKRNVECDIEVKDNKMIIKHLNAFGRLIVHIYELDELEDIEYIPVPGRFLFKGEQTYEIHLGYNEFENKVNPVKSVKIKDKATILVPNEIVDDLVKFIKDKTNKQPKEL